MSRGSDTGDPVGAGVAFTALKSICRGRLQSLINSGQLTGSPLTYVSRLEHELSVYEASGYSSVILIIADYIKWAKENGVVVGPGRGSAAGSLVVYLVGITSIDPIRFGLIFERFLNPERISLPDIDTDFSDRDAVIDYLKERYGTNRVVKVGVPSLFKPRSAIDEFARVLGVDYDTTKKITKAIGDSTTFVEAFKNSPELATYEADYFDLFKLARSIQGYVRQITTHPSAVILTRTPIGSEIPLHKISGQAKTGELATQWDGEELDSFGYVKLDILTVDNLSIIDRCIKMVDAGIDFYDLPLDDDKTLAGFKAGETVAVFQLEEPKSVGILQALDTVTFNDVVSVNACIRPGLDVGRFIRSRNDPSEIDYLLPELEPILKDTYGVILFQEQVMRMCVDLAGFTMGGADKFRKIIAKTANQREDFSTEDKEKFRLGYIEKGFDPDKFEKLWSMILACQTYIFNRAHATCYGYIAYADMYLKRHYPLQFMCAALQTRSREIYVKECDRLGITILPPDVNCSEANYSIEGDKIRMGLSCIKHVGTKAKAIIARRPYADEFDFIERAKPNQKQLEALCYSGALDGLLKEGKDRSRLIGYMLRDGSHDQPSLAELAVGEKESLGFYLVCNPLGDFYDELNGTVTPNTKQPVHAIVGGLISRIKLHEAKTGTMSFITLLTMDGEMDAVVWPKDYSIEAHKIAVGNVVVGKGRKTDRGNYSLKDITVLKST